jgi:hypothetical protein
MVKWCKVNMDVELNVLTLASDRDKQSVHLEYHN